MVSGGRMVEMGMDTAHVVIFRIIGLKSHKWENAPPNWEKGSNPCGDNWEGIYCIESRVTSLRLSSFGLIGQLSEDIDHLSELQILLFDFNESCGRIPSTLGLVRSLLVVLLSNNKLSGPLPNLSGLNSLNYLDMSNNSFESDFPSWISTLENLTTLVMEDTSLKGQIPVDLFSVPNLETVVLKRNKLNGTLEIGTTYSNRLRLIDLQSNFITDFPDDEVQHVQIILVDNPVCHETGTTASYCRIPVSKCDDPPMRPSP